MRRKKCWTSYLSKILEIVTNTLLIVSIFFVAFIVYRTETRCRQLQYTVDSLLNVPPVSRIDTIYVITATCYNAVEEQCNEDYLTTACGDKIKATHLAYNHRYLAVSRDLLSYFPYGTFVNVIGTGCYDGIWKVSDTMNPRFKNRIDFLVNPDMYMHKWENVYLQKIS